MTLYERIKMIGYSAHGVGHLAPPSPEFECRLCNCGIWTYDQLENGLCADCVEEYVCTECGREVEENESTNKYGVCPECEHENH